MLVVGGLWTYFSWYKVIQGSSSMMLPLLGCIYGDSWNAGLPQWYVLHGIDRLTIFARVLEGAAYRGTLLP